MFTVGDHLNDVAPDILDKHPVVKANYQLVRDYPGIKEHLQNRPNTPF